MMSNLPLETQIAKTEVLTSALADLLGKRPVVFRAGRWGLDRSTAAAIVECGYRVDCSVTPGRSWRESLGATHVGAPYDVYRMDPSQDHRIPVPGGALAEVPVSWGYTQRNWTLAHHINVLLDWPVLRRSRASRVGALLHLVNHAVLSPEIEPVDDMFRLVRQLLAKGVRHLHLTLHSSSLLPGLSPFTPTADSVELVYQRLGQILERISRLTPLRFATVGEAASLLAPAVAAPS
jgi:peptidoglycan/xylan/chitin deacetylase (PgdA/CDA1 family)